MKRWLIIAFWLAGSPLSAHAGLADTLILSTFTNHLAAADTGNMPTEGVPSSPTYRAQVHTELGVAYFSRGQLSIALQELNEAISADSGYAPAYNVLGLLYMQLQENDKARRSFERAVSLTPNDSEVQNNYGWFLCQAGQPKEAIEHFKQALKNPLYATPEKPNFNAGICTMKLGDDATAEGYFNKAIQLQPRMAPALYYLGEISFKRSDYTQAKTFIDRYMQLMLEPSAEALWLAVRIAHLSGDRQAEAQYNFMLRKRYPDSKEAQLLREGRYE